ncbi:hypothetical protein [Novosphingobium sp.]|uniref:hypothetical protein n=1 Tax=Novosphingobium sp. TaxID=1874826 RepID=UPI003569A373
MPFSDYSSTPSSNTSIAGISIAENSTPLANLNNAIRQLMADAKTFADAAPDTSTLMPKAAGTFSGTEPIYSGRGAYLHHNDSANTTGRVVFLPTGSARPTPAAGLIVFYYA